MPRHLHLDFETFSEADLKSVGAYRYAYDPSTEILCAGMALGQGEPVAWWQNQKSKDWQDLDAYWDALEDPTVLIYTHNAMMEAAICQALLEKTWNIKSPDLNRFRCTMSLARRAALPASLEKVGAALNLVSQKDTRGKALIRKFCMMQPAKKPTKKNPEGFPVRRVFPADDPTAFAELVEYCRQDVRVEQQVAVKLAYFDEPINNANYSLDARINARGVTVNVGALEHAQKLIEEETEVVGRKFKELTGISFTQGAKVLEWVNQRISSPLPDLQAETLNTFLEEYKITDEEEQEVVEALQMKQSVAYASIKKVATMLACHGPHDNRIRGMLAYHLATTGRWGSQLVQWQNMKRATIAYSEEAYQQICEGISRDMLDVCYGPPLEVISSCIRHFLQDKGPLLDADYAAIEARIVAWLAGQEDALEEYRQGVDRYKRMASFIYGVPEDDVNKFPQRFVGKQATLGCGFGMGAPKFRVTCKKMGNYNLPLGLEDTAVTMYRAKNKKIVSFWYDTERAAKRAIVNKGNAFQAGKLTFLMRDVAEIPFLLMQLPSKRKLAYPRPKIVDDRIYFYGKLGQTENWGDVTTWGGTLVENATQAVAADVMAQGAHNAERKGYEIATLIHDQGLSYHKPGQTPEEFVELLTDMPSWADGLPIAAEGSLVPFYKKD
jgi:DNA polymerase bacteriophage-type